MSNAITKVLIIEDSAEVVDAVTLAFKVRWPEAVTFSTDKGETGVELVASKQPDVVILDLGLPDIGGFEVLRQIRLFSRVPIVILTIRGEEADIVKGLELGADEYIVKPFKQLELLSRVKAVTRRQCAIIEEATPIICGQFHLDSSMRTLTYGKKQIQLTRIENIILSMLMKNAGVLVSYAALSEEIWDSEYPDANACLKVHIQHLRHKIEPDPSHPRAIITKHGLGYIFIKP